MLTTRRAIALGIAGLPLLPRSGFAADRVRMFELYNEDQGFSTRARELQGKLVEIQGFMAPHLKVDFELLHPVEYAGRDLPVLRHRGRLDRQHRLRADDEARNGDQAGPRALYGRDARDRPSDRFRNGLRQQGAPRRRLDQARMTHPAKGVLAAHNVSAQYADRTGEPIEALRAVNAQFRPGAMFAIMGPSGSGKTTFVHALAGIVPVSAGEIRFGDTLLSDLSERKRDAWRHAACGMVFQDFRLIEELDILANVILPATFSSFSV